MKGIKTAAIITINSPSKMTKNGRKRIAKWLFLQAESLIKEGNLYTDKRFTARYLYT